MILNPVDRAYLDLSNAIVALAADDYRNALNGISYSRKKPEKVIEECEKFFGSRWYRTLTKVDGQYLIDRLKQEHIENRKEQLCESS